jgi:hypothetical protein
MTVDKEKAKMLDLIASVEDTGAKLVKAIKAGHPIGGLMKQLYDALFRKCDRKETTVQEAIKKLELVMDGAWRRGKDPAIVANKIKLVVSLATKPYKRRVHA